MDAPRIVVGYDGSDDAVRAVRWAVTEAQSRGASLDVVHTYDFPYLDRLGPTTRDELHAEAQAVADDGRRLALDAEPDVAVTAAAVAGLPAAVLVERAVGAALLVVGHQGAGRGHHHILGSVATRCVQHADCSVVVVR